LIVKSVPGVPKNFSVTEKKKAVAFIGQDQGRFDRVIEEFFKGPYRYNQQAAGPLHDVLRKHPHLLRPHLKRFLLQLDKPGNYPAMTRNILRLLQVVDIPKPLQGKAVNTAMRIMEDPEELVAAKVFAITLLSNIAADHPELANEIRVVVESQYPYGTPAFRSRARKVLKSLEH
jgi:hypothetical protein